PAPPATTGNPADRRPIASASAEGPRAAPSPATSGAGAHSPSDAGALTRVPAPGSAPSADPAIAPAAGPSAETELRGLGASWVSYLPPPEVGIKIFAVGLVALVVALGGLVTIAARRRND